MRGRHSPRRSASRLIAYPPFSMPIPYSRFPISPPSFVERASPPASHVVYDSAPMHDGAVESATALGGDHA